MGLAGAGALSLLWWVSGTEDSLDTEIQPLFEESLPQAILFLSLLSPVRLKVQRMLKLKAR